MSDLVKYSDKAMYPSEPVTTGQVPQVYLLFAPADPLGQIAAACMMYEGKVCRNPYTITDEQRKHYWEEVQKTHLKAPLEFVDFHFMIEGVTRAFTHQMVRQRTAVYAQESLRFSVKHGLAEEVAYPPQLGGKEKITWDNTVDTIAEAYNKLISEGVPAEDARGLLPHNIKTRLNYKTNLRNLLEHTGNRLCTQAQFEWRMALSQVRQEIFNYQPTNNLNNCWQYEMIAGEPGLFVPVCYAMGKCPFNADFDRDCKIRGRVEEGKFSEIDPGEWLLDPTAARDA